VLLAFSLLCVLDHVKNAKSKCQVGSCCGDWIGLGIRGDGALSYADPRLEWLLVSDMSWSPWAPLFHCMQLEAPWLPKRGVDSFLLDTPQLTLESKVASLEYLEALALFDKTTTWDVVFWRVLYLPHVVGHLAPRRATIVPLFSGEFFNVWDPFAKSKRGKRVPTRFSCWGDAGVGKPAVPKLALSLGPLAIDGGLLEVSDRVGDGNSDDESGLNFSDVESSRTESLHPADDEDLEELLFGPTPDRDGASSAGSSGIATPRAGAPPSPPPSPMPIEEVLPPHIDTIDGEEEPVIVLPPEPEAGVPLAAGELAACPVDALVALAVHGEHRLALASVLIPGCGRIAFYASGDFYALCNDPMHTMDHFGGHTNHCNRARTSRPGRARHQGRPLGFLMAWLVHAVEFVESYEHKPFKPSFAQRRAARTALRLIPGSLALFHHERGKRDDEVDSEPDNFH
jgi:hypothetical protein